MLFAYPEMPYRLNVHTELLAIADIAKKGYFYPFFCIPNAEFLARVLTNLCRTNQFVQNIIFSYCDIGIYRVEKVKIKSHQNMLFDWIKSE